MALKVRRLAHALGAKITGWICANRWATFGSRIVETCWRSLK